MALRGRGLWEEIDPEGRTYMKGISGLMKGTPESSSPFLPCEDARNQQSASQQSTLTRTSIDQEGQ